MKKNYRNPRSLAMDIIRGNWLLDNPHQFRDIARAFINGELKGKDSVPETVLRDDCSVIDFAASVEHRLESMSSDASPAGGAEERSLVLVVPLHGTLTKYDSCLGVSTLEAAAILEEYALGDERIGAVVLDIDSPGGAGNAVAPMVAAIRKVQASGRPVLAHVDLCCSAAYWIACATDAIFADNLTSSIGSIGVYRTVIYDRENKESGYREIDVYAPESTDKNLAYREALEGKFDRMQGDLSEVVQMFIAAVREGRPDLKEEAGVLSGAVFSPGKAVDLGMIDGMADLDDCIEIAYARASLK
ncbi:MAG: S49 family peptidase [Bacteroidales bacterium]|nr:S49 family peptidase [Bacteroidales bacterium]